MRQDLAKGLVMARSRIPIPPEISFYPVFRQTPGFLKTLLDALWDKPPYLLTDRAYHSF
jgi:hypothetical protein